MFFGVDLILLNIFMLLAGFVSCINLALISANNLQVEIESFFWHYTQQ